MPATLSHRCPNLLLVACLLVPGALLLAPAAAWAREAGGHEPLQVTVSILPQAWFVEKVGGEQVQVAVLVGPGHSPATYEPVPRQMAALEQADLFLSAGVPFERGLLPKIEALPAAPMVRGPRPAVNHDPSDGHHHDHGHDPHTWLDPRQAAALADTIAAVLTELDPVGAREYASRLTALQAELARLDRDIRKLLVCCPGGRFLVFHPAFGHFATAYGLTQIAVEAGGHEPGPRQLATVIDTAREAGLTTVVVQPQFSRRSAETVAEAIGARVVVLDPLAPDYGTNLRHIAAALAEILQAAKGKP